MIIAIAHVQRVRRHAQANRHVELPLAVATAARATSPVTAHRPKVRAVGEPQLLHAVLETVTHEETGTIARQAMRHTLKLTLDLIRVDGDTVLVGKFEDARRRALLVGEDLHAIVARVRHS